MNAENKYPLVSIIMPTYNREALIGETIDSILRQTFHDWELLIIDDGSEDKTGELVNRLVDPRIIFYKAGRHGIGGRIKNIGLQMAKGAFIAFADSDDPWQETKLQKQLDAIKDFPDAGFCLTGGYIFETPGQPIEFFYKSKTGLKYGDLFVDCFRSEVALFAQALMFRKECIDEVGFFKEVKSFSDIDFIANLAYHYKGVVIYEPLVFRRMHDDNYIHDNWEKSYHEGVEFIKANKHRLPRRVVQEALFRLYINFGEAQIRRKNKSAALSSFMSAWKHKPATIIPIKKSLKAIFKSHISS